MKFPLGEMTVGDILDRGIKLLFACLPSMYAIQLAVLSPMILAQILYPFLLQIKPGDQGPDLQMALAGLGILLFAVLLALVLQPIGTAAVLRIVMQEYVDQRVSTGQALSYALSRFLPLIGVSIVVGLLVVVGMMLCCIPGIYFLVTYAFVSQIVVLEKLGVGDSMQRSSTLVSGHRWRVFGVLALIGVANWFIQVGIGMGLGAVLPPQEVVPAGNGVRLQINAVNHVVTTLVSQLVSILFSTYLAVCTTLLYLDLRIRKEGFDIEIATGMKPERRDDDREYDDDYEDDEYDRDRR